MVAWNMLKKLKQQFQSKKDEINLEAFNHLVQALTKRYETNDEI